MESFLVLTVLISPVWASKTWNTVKVNSKVKRVLGGQEGGWSTVVDLSCCGVWESLRLLLAAYSWQNNMDVHHTQRQKRGGEKLWLYLCGLLLSSTAAAISANSMLSPSQMSLPFRDTIDAYPLSLSVSPSRSLSLSVHAWAILWICDVLWYLVRFYCIA